MFTLEYLTSEGFIRTLKNVCTEFPSKWKVWKKQIKKFEKILSKDQHKILKDKILNLIPDQNEEEAENCDMNAPSNAKAKMAYMELKKNDSKNKALKKMRQNLFESVWAQRKYTNRNSLTSIIYVLVTKETTLAKALLSKEFSCHPVFRTRKCVAANDSSSCCMVFIDETGRVYQNWIDFINNNVLPKGTMIAPKNGYYTFNSDDVVNLEGYYTPASSNLNSVLETADTASAVTGFLSVGVSIAAVFTLPVAAPIVAAASVAGLATAVYSGARAGSTLIDRSLHEQSISLSDRQARGSWLGVLGGAVGLGASGATRALTTAAAAGREVSLVSTLVVNGMNISSIVLSGSGVANGILDMILKLNDDEEITAMDALQLAASLVLFTHSVNNFRLASNIVTETRNNHIKSYRDGLSNRQRRMFDKMTKETIRIKGVDKGRIDVIRSVNEIPSKQYLNDLHKINRQLNKQQVRPSFGGDKKPVLLNNDVAVDTKVLRNSVQHSKGPDVLSQVKQTIPKSHTQNIDTNTILNKTGANIMPNRTLFADNKNNNYEVPDYKANAFKEPTVNPVKELMKASFPLLSGAMISFADLGSSLFTHVINAETLEDAVINMARQYTDEAFNFLINLAKHFIENSLEFIEAKLRIQIPRELVLVKIKEFTGLYEKIDLEVLKEKQLDIITKLTNFFRSDEAVNYAQNEPRNDAQARFIFTNPNSSNDSAEDLNTAKIVLACGAVVPLADFGSSFLEHIMNVGSFQDVALDMANEFPESTFRFMFDLTQQFIKSDLDNIHNVLKTHIATEGILYRMLSHCLENYANLEHEFLTNKSSEILRTLKTYFLSLNPNNKGNGTQCTVCKGHYTVCVL